MSSPIVQGRVVLWFLCAAALLEIVLYRLLGPALEMEGVPAWTRGAVLAVGAYLVNLEWAAGPGVLALHLSAAVRPGTGPARVMQWGMLLTYLGMTGALAAFPDWPAWIEVATRLSQGQMQVLAQGTCLCLALILCLQGIIGGGDRRARAGLLLVLLPPLTHHATLWMVVNASPDRDLAVLSWVNGETCALLCGALWPLLLLPWPRKGKDPALRFGVVAALALCAAALALSILDFATAEQAIYRLVSVRLQVAPLWRAAFLISLFGVALTTVVSLLRGGTMAVRGGGLLLCVLAGPDLANPARLSLYLAGVAAVLASIDAGRGGPARL